MKLYIIAMAVSLFAAALSTATLLNNCKHEDSLKGYHCLHSGQRYTWKNIDCREDAQ